MVATELITGMEDIINYLKQLEQENKQLKEENKKLLGNIEKIKETSLRWQERADFNLSDSEESDEEDKYEDDPEWNCGYGYTVKDGEYRISMCGGCKEWVDYVIKKDGCFVHSWEGWKKVRTFISCPEGNNLKVVWLGDPDYKMDEGEIDMFEMVKECFIEEIMEYESDDDQ
jgi:hypothetical protein